MKKYINEGIASFVFAFLCFGCATALKEVNNANLCIAFLCGITFICLYFIFHSKSGCHLNPLVSLSLAINKKISVKDFWFYFFSQLLGTIVACLLLVVFSFMLDPSFASNFNITQSGYAQMSQSGVTLGGCFLVEVFASFILISVVLNVKCSKANSKFAAFIIGALLFFLYMVVIPINGMSINPVWSISTALVFGLAKFSFVAITQVWMFVAASIIGCVFAVFTCNFFAERKTKEKKINSEISAKSTSKNSDMKKNDDSLSSTKANMHHEENMFAGDKDVFKID